jgi:alpha-beta hydrolase superfamily lysophospholipase
MAMNDSLQTTFLKVDKASIYSWHLQAVSPRQDGLTIAFLHGAGQSSSERFMTLAQLFVDSGVSVVGLDFIGHGKTGGEIS